MSKKILTLLWKFLIWMFLIPQAFYRMLSWEIIKFAYCVQRKVSFLWKKDRVLRTKEQSQAPKSVAFFLTKKLGLFAQCQDIFWFRKYKTFFPISFVKAGRWKLANLHTIVWTMITTYFNTVHGSILVVNN